MGIALSFHSPWRKEKGANATRSPFFGVLKNLPRWAAWEELLNEFLHVHFVDIVDRRGGEPHVHIGPTRLDGPGQAQVSRGRLYRGLVEAGRNGTPAFEAAANMVFTVTSM